MNFIVLQFNELKKIILFFIGLVALVFSFIYVFQYLLSTIKWIKTSLSVWKILSFSITSSLLIIGVLLNKFRIKYLWLGNLLSKPSINGLWKGSLISSYKREVDDDPLPPIEIYFYIKQTYFAISIQSFTKSQRSESILATIYTNNFSSSTKFMYIYQLTRTKNSENKITLGSGELLITDNCSKMEGVYWTNSTTHGEIEMNLVDRKALSIDSFISAEAHVDSLNIS
ncbi:hypothetical protein AADH33_03885 [Psychrobacter sp. KFRI-CH2-11]|uniref:Cap15 family cyclic dinucleotide receptor domain-containing protein n=1 Tax=Psychrobacter sp. KFRI-CH2-11 TaxID=3156079 RepID=UPI003251A1A8